MDPFDKPKSRRTRRRLEAAASEPAPPQRNIDDRVLAEMGIAVEEFAALTEVQRAYVCQCLNEYMEEGTSITASSLVQADYKWLPVSCEQFLEDPEYLGSFTKDMYPACRAALVETFDGTSSPVEVILGGSIGWGKTTLAAAGMLYDIYRVGCLRNPHEYYGLMPGAKIAFAIYSTSKEQAADSAFGKMLTWVEGSPYFKSRMPKVGKHTTRMVFSKSPILVITGSQEVHSIGKDMYGFLLDEANFLTAKSAKDDEQGRAYAIYTNAKNRMTSRFQESGSTRVPGKVWLISSKRSHAAFLENHIKASKTQISEGLSRVYEYARWHVMKASKYTMPKFRVEVGDLINPSRVLKPEEDPRAGADVIVVPGEFYQNFIDDIDGSLRDIAGIATFGMCPLFHDRNVILNCTTDRITHPFKKSEISTDILDDVSIVDYFDPKVMFQIRNGKYVPRYHALAPRFIHIDIGLTMDSMGIACVHMAGWKTVRRPRPDGTWYEDKAPVIDTDFTLRVNPPPGSEIDLAKARGFVLSLRDYGLPIWRVTLDGYQSRDTMQILRRAEFDAVLYSVDKTDDAYMTLRQAFVEQRINIYKYATLERELFELERNIEERTVDHPKVSPMTGKRGSKDVSDALAGSVYNCMIDLEAAVSPLTGTSPVDNLDSGVKTTHGELDWSELDKEVRV